MYYAAKSYAHQIKRSEEYKKLNPVIFLGILDFTLFEGDKFLTQHFFINQQTGNRDIDHMELNFIELSKFTKTEEECTSLSDKWIYFLKNADDLKVVPSNIKTDELKIAYETAEQFGWTEGELELYEARSRFVAAQMDALETKKIEGRIEGKIQGKIEGKTEERNEIIKKMKKLGMTKDEISRIFSV